MLFRLFFFIIIHATLFAEGELDLALKMFCGNDPYTVKAVEMGNSNLNYILEWNGSKYFIKSGTEANELFGVSLQREWQGNLAAAKTGLAPEGLYFSEQDKLMITEFIDNSVPVNKNDEHFLASFCSTARQLHGLDKTGFESYCPFMCIRDYLEKAKARGAVLPHVLFSRLMPELERLEKTIKLKSVPCHLDINKGNMLYDGQKLLLIDWEYAALSDPFFDLAFYAVNFELNDEEIEELLVQYGSEVNEETIAHFNAMCFLAEMRECLWSYLKTQISERSYLERAEYFLKKASERLDKVFH